MEIVRGIGGAPAPDAPGDTQFVYTSLSPEHIQPHDSPGSPFLGRLTCLIVSNSQLKHGMRYGGCPVAKFQTWKEGWQWKGSHLLKLVTLFLSRG